MSESYSDEETSGAAPHTDGGIAVARALLARLLADVDAGLLVSALVAEGAAAGGATTGAAPAAAADDPSIRELQRVRRQYAVGAAARATRHDLNNPLTALLAEAQLLEMEAATPDQRAAAGRIVELARRVAAVARRLDGGERSTVG